MSTESPLKLSVYHADQPESTLFITFSLWDATQRLIVGNMQYLSVFDICRKWQSSPFMSIWSAEDPVVSLFHSAAVSGHMSLALSHPDSMHMPY